MKRKQALPIADIIYAGLQFSMNEEGKQRFNEHLVCNAWEKVLGATIMTYTSDMSFKNGTLYVHLFSAALRQDLFIKRNTLMDKLNEELGQKIIYVIVFR